MPPLPGVIAFRATVTGLVQGVGFRYWTARRARELGVSGWVRNVVDGSVEVFAQGEPGPVAALAEWLQHGPPHARVSDVSRRAEDADSRLATFEILG